MADAERFEILLAEDDAALREALAETLRQEGFAVRAAADGSQALEAFARKRPDVVLLDVKMPVMDGYEACRAIRVSNREIPIIFLSCFVSDEDQIAGLEAGADDYIAKSASTAMLVARARSALARNRRLNLSIAPDSMTKTEAGIYRLLKDAPGRVFSYREIFASIFGEGYYADEGSLRTHISHLRKKLPPGESIVAKRGRGFSLIHISTLSQP